MPMEPPKVKDIFLAALEIPDAAARQAYVDSVCGTNAELLNCVRDMLEAHQKAKTPVPQVPEGPTQAETTPPFPVPVAATLSPGTIIDQRYKIIELIAEGGMGSVYRACRVSDMRMEVAIKLVKPGMASIQILQRFNIERQALALMKHENIAKVLDAGTTGGGHPYFVMELVKGLPITKFCDDNKLTVNERLELFEKVCSAVQHAHQKGIVHRDLKPSNILVGLFDEKAVPKVIDFGLAKAIYQPITDDILHTKFGTFVGTWQYTAPEQAILNNLDIDTRSDIYSLGVILYELLTGNPPIEKSRITHAVMEEVLRMIREEEPPKPSTKIHSSDQRPSIAALRRSEPLQLERQVRGELDWIVMKALEKDRNRRYATASDLARDVTSYLQGEHVSAAPPSKVYRLKCFYRKHRGKILIGSVLTVLLIFCAVVSTVGFINATNSEKKAREQLATANALADFIDTGMFAAVDPLERAKLNLPIESGILVRDMLARSAANVDKGAFSDQPMVEMRIRYILGKAFFAIGDNNAAFKQLDASDKIAMNHLGEMSAERLPILGKKGDVSYNLGNYPRAKSEYQLALEGWKANRKEDGHDALMVQIKKLEIDKSETNKPEELQQIALQVQLLLKRIALTQDHISFVQASLLSADLASAMNQPGKALEELETTLRYGKQKLGPDHPNTLSVMNSLASELHAQKLAIRAESTYLELLEKAERVYDADSVILALYRNNYGAYCVGQKKYALAEKLFRESVPVFVKVSPNHPYTLIARCNVYDMKLMQRDFEGALAGYQQLSSLFMIAFGENAAEYQALLRDTARALVELNKNDEAIVILKKLAKISVDSNDKESQQLLIGLKLIKRILAQKNMDNRYRELIEKINVYIQQLSPSHSKLLDAIKSIK